MRAEATTQFSVAIACVLWLGLVHADDQPELALLVSEDFEKGAQRWEPTDPDAWKITKTAEGNVYSQFQQSKYKPPHRSPFNIALLKDIYVGDLVLEVKLQSTIRDYGHRDMCLVFAYQDPAHFYYVHLGKKTDDHANQIFIVNDKPRSKISSKTTPGTNWDDQWHHVKIVRRVSDGTIEVYFDDMKQPVMTAKDKTFTWGRVGIGSFDDTGNWDDLTLRGQKVQKQKQCTCGPPSALRAWTAGRRGVAADGINARAVAS